MTPLEWAKTQLGVKEATGRNDGQPLMRYALKDEAPLPWCARFVRAAFVQAGTPLPGNRWKLGSVAYMEDQLKRAGRWAPPGYTPQPGDLVFFSWRAGSDAGRGRHVAIVERVDGDMLHTIDGNVDNAVVRCARGRHRGVTGYGANHRGTIQLFH